MKGYAHSERDLERLLGGREAAVVRWLSLKDLGAASAARLAEAELPSLESLSTAGCRFDGAAWAALGRAPFLPRLRSLALTSSSGTTSGLEGLLAREQPLALRRLDLANRRVRGAERGAPNAFADEAARVLAEASCLRGLEELDLTGTSVGDAGLRALVRGLPALRRLHLWYTRASADVAEALERRVRTEGRPALRIEVRYRGGRRDW